MTNPPDDYPGHDLEALADLPRYTAWILGHFEPHLRGRVLEVGAGLGGFAASYADRARAVVLEEPSPSLLPRLRARFATLAHVRVVGEPMSLSATGPPEEGGLAGEPFDAAVLVNVLEHVEDDLAMLRLLFDVLLPGGALLLFVPALAFLYGSLDALVGHHRRYSRSGLAERVRTAGFVIEKLRWFDGAGVLPWLVTGRLLRARGFDARAAALYDRCVVPVASRVERWVEPPFGKNLVCVARRPAS